MASPAETQRPVRQSQAPKNESGALEPLWEGPADRGHVSGVRFAVCSPRRELTLAPRPRQGVSYASSLHTKFFVRPRSAWTGTAAAAVSLTPGRVEPLRSLSTVISAGYGAPDLRMAIWTSLQPSNHAFVSPVLVLEHPRNVGLLGRARGWRKMRCLWPIQPPSAARSISRGARPSSPVEAAGSGRRWPAVSRRRAPTS